ncbi:MAG: AAA domain-containing protein [Cyanobacterium sp.]
MSTFPQLFPPTSEQLIEINPLDEHEAPVKQNPEEDYFYWYYLNKFFPDYIKRNYRFQEYYPDFIYVDQEAGIYIDIECDEPYVYSNNEPTHYQELESEKQRNLAFTNGGWFVIRFAEEQLVCYPERCCKYIADVIANLTENYFLLQQFNHVSELPNINHWTKLEAESLAKERYRNSYLNTAYNHNLPDSRKDFIYSLKSFINVEHDTQVRDVKETWASPIEERLEQGRAIAPVELINQSRTQITAKFSENLSKFAPGDDLLLNTGNPFHKEDKYKCTLEEEKDNLLVLKLQQKIDLTPEDFNRKWVLDLQLFDLRHLLLDTLNKIELDDSLQNKIIGIIEGNITPKLDVNSATLEQLKNKGFDTNYIEKLNLTLKQKEGLINALAINNYYLIQGPPGTGKTWLLAHIAYLLAQQGQTVLITAFTHTAINNALKKIAQVTGYQKVIKIGKADKNIGLTWENHSIANYEYLKHSPYKNDTKGLIIGATCFSVGGNRLKGIKFDTIIFDEAGQITLPVAIKGMTEGYKYIFIGDHQQMSPVVAGVHRQSWVTYSIFETLFNHAPGTMLDITHRLNEEINQFPSQYFYQGLLQPSPEAMSRKLELPIQPQVYGDVLNPEISSIFVEVNHQGQGLNSPQEAEIIVEIVAETVQCGVNLGEIAIVVPYRSQARLIRQKLQKIALEFNLPNLTSILVNTVESMQGQERNIIILSLTTSDPFHAAQKADFYFQPNRLNVAITRGRVKRIVVGSPNVFKAKPEQPEHQKWVDCFRAFYESNNTITISEARGLKTIDKNNSSDTEKSEILDTQNSAITKKENKSTVNMSNNQEIDLTHKSIEIKDLAQYLEKLSTSVSKADLVTNFAPLLLRVLGFGEKQIKHKVSTGNGKEIVDFQINEQQTNLPFLLLAIENINLEFDNDNPQYQARVTNLKKDLLAPKFKKVQWGLISNGKQIQLFRKHGKVIYPASIIEELNPNNLEEFEEKIIRLKTQIQNPPTALTVAIYNNKGGVGKTTTTINLAGMLSACRKKVLIIDLDYDQQDLTSTLGLKPNSVTLYECLTSRDKNINEAIITYKKDLKKLGTYGFDVIPADKKLVQDTETLNRQLFKITRLKQLLKPLTLIYDYILIDTPPNWRDQSQLSIYASNVVLIPNQYTRKSIKNAITTITEYLPEVAEYRKKVEKDHGAIALPIMFNGGNATNNQIKMIYDLIEININHYKQKDIDLTPYFFPHHNSLNKNRQVFHLPHSAFIEKAENYHVPAVYRYQKAVDNYKTLIKEYFI